MYSFENLTENKDLIARKLSKHINSLSSKNINFLFREGVKNSKLLSVFDKLLRLLLVKLIDSYQRYLSPFKGYSCAYRIASGGESCSEYVKKTLTNTNLFETTLLTKQRFKACSDASTSYKGKIIGPDTVDPECISGCCGGLIGLGICEAAKKR